MISYATQGYATLPTLAQHAPTLVHAISLRGLGSMSYTAGAPPPETIRHNREGFLSLLGLDLGALVVAQQCHTANIRAVTAADRGAGAYASDTGFAATDALITAAPGVWLGILVADCAPVILYDPARRVLGVAHAGWRGALAQIAAQTVQQMAAQFGCQPAQMWAAVGPCIGAQRYEVGDDVVEAAQAAFPQAWAQFFRQPPECPRPFFDLPGAIGYQLAQAGVPPAQIAQADACTFEEADTFFSYRREGQRSGRMLCVAGLREAAQLAP
jgi:hypothetical protein